MEEGMTEVEAALQNKVVNMEHNQNALVQENQKLRDTIVSIQEEKTGPMIFAKMLAVKRDIGSVQKDQKNMGQGWNFRGIDQFMNALHPILNKHGVGILPSVVQHSEPKFITNEKTGRTSKNTQITVKYTFFAEDGSTVEVIMPAEGVDPGDKGTNKALSAAFKYALMQTFVVPTEDMEEGDLSNATVDGDGGKASAPKKKAVAPKIAAPKAAEKTSFRRKPAAPAAESPSEEL